METRSSEPEELSDIITRVRAKELAAIAARSEEERHAWEESERERLRAERYAVLRSWEVPELALSTLAPRRLRPTKALERVKAWRSECSRERWCQVLSGPPGTGKSIAAAWWLLQESEGRKPDPNPVMRWCRSATLVRVSSFDGTLEKFAKGPLVIDDLGAEYADQRKHYLARLDELIDIRYSNFQPTVVTTNLNAKDFAARYEERITDRLRQGSGFFEMTGVSMRGSAQ